MNSESQEEYYCDLNVVTTCRYRLVGQQSQCRGYGVHSLGRRASDNVCVWFRCIGDGQWLCTNPSATQDALDRFKAANCMEAHK